jgi:hypothetical protein
MAARKKRPGKIKKPLVDMLPEMLISALANHDDFIITYETSPEDDSKKLHVLTGKLITPCMLGTLKNRVEIQAKDGSTLFTREWK